MVNVVCIVEGAGEVEAVPVLMRRILGEVTPGLAVTIPKPIRLNRSAFINDGRLANAMNLAAKHVGHSGAVLLFLDADDDCPAELGPDVLARARRARPDLRTTVVVANREFESWLLAGAMSLRGRRGLRADIESPVDPEFFRDAKGWLRDRMEVGSSYRETLDQTALTSLFDLRAARSAPSFDRCYRKIEELVADALP